MTGYEETLFNRVIELSQSKHWEDAVNEWKIVSCEEDLVGASQCICGREDIKYLYTLQNNLTGNTLHPVCSGCIYGFGREDLIKEAEMKKSLFKLLHTLEESSSIILNPDFFTVDILQYLYEQGAFLPVKYNEYNGYNDYSFLLAMYKRIRKASTWVKPDITKAQYRKMSAIIRNSVLPYLRGNLEVRKEIS